MILIDRFENVPVNSVTYIIRKKDNPEAVIIDPGTLNDERLIDFAEKNNILPKYILLTHEHFDHILGVNHLREIFPKIIVCASKKTSERLNDCKKNLSVFHDQSCLSVAPADIILEEKAYFFSDIEFQVLETPGHTDSSLCFSFESYLISGDFIIPGEKTVTKLPTGSKKSYEESFKKYYSLFSEKIILPGHGVVFELKDYFRGYI